MFTKLVGQGLQLAPQELEVQKFNPDGTLKMRYWAQVLGANQNERLIRAVGDFEHQILEEYWLRDGDAYIEWYSREKGFNILEIHAQASSEIKFWYCNICSPARFEGDKIIWTDLALDLLVNPRGQYFLLDQDELAGLKLDWLRYAQVWKNLKELLVFLQASQIN